MEKNWKTNIEENTSYGCLKAISALHASTLPSLSAAAACRQQPLTIPSGGLRSCCTSGGKLLLEWKRRRCLLTWFKATLPDFEPSPRLCWAIMQNVIWIKKNKKRKLYLQGASINEAIVAAGYILHLCLSINAWLVIAVSCSDTG